LRKQIEEIVDAKCLTCSKLIVAKSHHHAICFECKDELDRKEHEQYCNEYRKKVELDPLIKYCYEINKIPEPCEERPS
jgi:hypothetical protein